MTVLVFDGSVLAADRRATDARGRVTTTTKIHRSLGGELLAGTGDAAVCADLKAWYLAGARPDDFPVTARANVADLYVFSRSGVLHYYSGPHPCTIECPHVVAGSGGEVARGVLHMGGTAVQAVEAACLYRGDCGGGIDTLGLDA
jgi:hypothetical protein